MTFARRPIEVIEIKQPLCAETFGVGACEATGDECWNTDATCKFRAALDLSETLPLYFVRDEAHEWVSAAESMAVATGGTVTDETVGGIEYRVHTFTGDGDFVAPHPMVVEYLVVGGGGGGGARAGGGGGGGRVLQGFTSLEPGTHPIAIGAGGDGQTHGGSINPGSATTAFGLTAPGGGGGRGGASNEDGGPGANGGGGGGTGNSDTSGGAGDGEGNPGGGGRGAAGGSAGGGGGSDAAPGENGVAGSRGGFGASGVETWAGTFGAGGDGGYQQSTAVPGASAPPNTGDGGDGASGESPDEPSGGDGGSGIVVIRYAKAFQPALAIGSLIRTSVAPTVLNVAGGSRNRGPLGYRGVLSVRIKDHPWNDVGTDPYVDDRSYDPVERGSFWSKWLKRNPFHVGYQINHYSGVRGQSLAQMTRRQYEIEKIDAGRDGVTIRAKDLLNRVNEVAAPFLSPGVLSVDMLQNATTFFVAGAVADDYQLPSGIVRIGDEFIRYTDVIDLFTSLQFVGITRGAVGTEISAHDQNERVQRVLFWEDEPFQNIAYELITDWADADPDIIDKPAWDAEKDLFRPAFNFTAYISQPTQVVDLLAEVALQSMANIWWDEREQEVILRAVRPNEGKPLASDDADILAGSYAIKELPEERVSQVFVYYNLRSPIASPTDSTSYANASVFIDVNKQIQYGGTPAIRELFCRFTRTGPIANTIAATYLRRFRDVRREITFDLRNDAAIWTGDTLDVEHFLDTDFTGLPDRNEWLILSAQEIDSGAVYRFTAEDNNMGGVLWVWVDDTTTSLTWADATAEERETVGYWLDDDGNDAGGNPAPFRWL